jgi:peptide/nickel transport system substrate-binding protein
VLLLFSCNNKKRNLNENTLLVHLPFKTKGLHPTNDVDAVRANLFDLIHRSLLERDIRNNTIVPALLTKLPEVSSDGKKMFFEIKSDIKWDDGSAFTVEDAIFSIKILVCPLVNNPSYKPTYIPIFENIEADSLNPNKFIFSTKGYNRSNIELFLEIYMIQKSKWDKTGATDKYSMKDFLSQTFTPSKELIKWSEEFNNKANSTRLSSLEGLGQYKITKWEPDSYMILEKKNNWWGKNDTSFFNKAEADKIVFKIILDETSLYYAIKNNQIDVTTKITTSKLLKFQKHNYFNKTYYSSFTNQFAYTYICLNSKPNATRQKPLFTSKKVRRAMAHLVPVDDIIKIFSKGHATRMITNVYPYKIGFNKKLKPIEYNLSKAIKLLEEEGWTDTDGDNIRDKIVNGEKVKFSFQLIYPNIVPGNKEICLLIKDCMYKAGIEMNPTAREFGQFYQECYNQTFDASMGAWLGSSGHEDFSQLFSTQSWAMHGENFGGFGNYKSDSLIQAANLTQDDSVYCRIVEKFQEIIYAEQPYIFLMSPKSKVIINRRFINPHAFPEKPNVYLNILKLGNKSSSKTIPTVL